MQVSIETVKGLERKMTISVPTGKVEEEVNLRLRNLANKAKIDGFRAGKAPLNLIKRRFATSVLYEVTEKIAKENFEESIKNHKLRLAAPATFFPEQMELGKDFTCSFTFEIIPEINLSELKNDEIEVIRAEITSADLDKMLEKLQEQNKDWVELEASRAVESGDKITLDAIGYIDNEPFEGGTLSNYEFVTGEGKMLPDFEKGLIGQQKGEPFVIDMTFPADYHAELAGKNVQFKATINKIMEGKFPPLDDAFAEKFNVNKGGIEALKKDLEEHMRRELELKLSTNNRNKIFDTFLAANPIEVPNALLENEIANLKHEMYHQIFGHEHSDNEVIPDFPRELFEDRAKNRVALALIIPEYIKKHKIVADKKRMKAKADMLASAYENPSEFYDMLEKGNEKSFLESLVIEEIVADKIAEHAKLVEKQMDYDSVMNPKKEEENVVKSKKGSKKAKEAEGE